MFITTLFTIAKICNQPSCPSMDNWIKKMWCIYTMKYYSAIKKNEIRLAWWLTPVIPAFWEAEVGGSSDPGSSKPAWPTWWNPVSTKNTKISHMWWWVPVVSATQETKKDKNHLSLGRSRLQWAVIAPLHSSSALCDRMRRCQKTKNPHEGPTTGD